MTALAGALTSAELEELEAFLSSPALEDRSMDLSMLEGYLTAIVIGPRTIMPSEWMPRIWDRYEGEQGPEFADLEQAHHITALVLRFYNGVIRCFMEDPASFEPLFWQDVVWGAAEWCEGFLAGTAFCEKEWSGLWQALPDLHEPFVRLGTDEGLAGIRDQQEAQALMDAIEPAFVASHAIWFSRRQQRPEGLVRDTVDHGPAAGPWRRPDPKIGRNDPCPCGSGKKFKKCCGAEGVTSVH